MALWFLSSTLLWGLVSVSVIVLILNKLKEWFGHKTYVWDPQFCSTDLTGKTAVVTGANRGIPMTLTKEGLEFTFATNYLGPFLLTNLLKGALQRAGSARVVNVSSYVHVQGHIDEKDLKGIGGPLKPYQYYSCSKLQLTSFSGELARRLQGTGVTVNSVDPGLVYTGIMKNYFWLYRFAFWIFSFFMKNAKQGAIPVLYLCLAKELDGISGRYFSDTFVIRLPSEAAQDLHVAQSLWNASVRLTNLDKMD